MTTITRSCYICKDQCNEKSPCLCGNNNFDISYVHNTCFLQYINHSNIKQCRFCKYELSYLHFEKSTINIFFFIKYFFNFIFNIICHFGFHIYNFHYCFNVYEQNPELLEFIDYNLNNNNNILLYSKENFTYDVILLFSLLMLVYVFI